MKINIAKQAFFSNFELVLCAALLDISNKFPTNRNEANKPFSHFPHEGTAIHRRGNFSIPCLLGSRAASPPRVEGVGGIADIKRHAGYAGALQHKACVKKS